MIGNVISYFLFSPAFICLAIRFGSSPEFRTYISKTILNISVRIEETAFLIEFIHKNSYNAENLENAILIQGDNNTLNININMSKENFTKLENLQLNLKKLKSSLENSENIEDDTKIKIESLLNESELILKESTNYDDWKSKLVK